MAFAEHFPYVCVGKGLESGDFELEKVVLIGVKVDCVDPSRVCDGQILEQVISTTREAEYRVTVFNLQQTLAHSRIFPSESVEIVMIELHVLLQLFIVMNP